MDSRRYSLDNKESSGFVKVLQLIFGIVCIAVSLWWAWFIIKSPEHGNYWFATMFMLFFGAFQIYSGLGHAAKYVEFKDESVTVKKSAIGMKEKMEASRIDKIEVLPLSVRFKLKDNRSVTISFGMSIALSIDAIKDFLIEWSDKNKVVIEEKTDRL